MGTNFYWVEPPKEFENNDILRHIGKRSGAGRYCERCGISFCKEGTQFIHSGYSDWFDKCPVCNSEGIVACSFTWTSMRQKDIIKNIINLDRKIIKDEYGGLFTPKEFLNIELGNSVIEFQLYCNFC